MAKRAECLEFPAQAWPRRKYEFAAEQFVVGEQSKRRTTRQRYQRQPTGK